MHVEIEQIHANTCKTLTPMSGKLVKDLLTYQTKTQVYDEESGYTKVFDIKKSIGETRTGVHYFPYGLVSYIKNKLIKQDHSIELIEIKSKNLPYKLFPILPGIKFDNYQKLMLKKIGPHKRGILIAGTGSGKSTVLGGIISKFNCPNTLIVTPNRIIFNQLFESFTKWFGKDKVGKLGDGINDVKHITIATFQSLKLYDKKKIKNIEIILIDECHLINNTIIKFLKKLNNVHYRYGVTATEQKVNQNFVKTMEMVGYIGPILSKIKDEQVERIVPASVKMISFFCHSAKGMNYQEILRNDVLLSKIRNEKFIRAAKGLLLDKGLTCLFLLDETRQGEMIYELAKKMNLDPYLVHAKMPKTIIDQIKNDLNNRKINFVIATKVFGTGMDLPNVDGVGLLSARKSEIDTIQKIGRGRRRTINKKELIVIDSIDKIHGKQKACKYFYDYSLERLKIYEKKGWEISKIIL